MPLNMNKDVFITCAVTGSGSSQDRSPHVPRSPAQIAESAIAAAKAGAAVVHCHVHGSVRHRTRVHGNELFRGRNPCLTDPCTIGNF